MPPLRVLAVNTSPFKTQPKPKPKPTSKEAKVQQNLRIAERLNGRLAMQGWLFGTLNQFVLHEGGIQQQLHDPHNLMTLAAVTSLVTLGTTVTQKDIDCESYFAWTPDNEVLNGRLAMAAITVAAIFNL